MLHFKDGDTVMVKHQQEMGELKVSIGYDPVDEPFTTLQGFHVTHYVRVSSETNPLVKDCGYHWDNLRMIAVKPNEEVLKDLLT